MTAEHLDRKGSVPPRLAGPVRRREPTAVAHGADRLGEKPRTLAEVLRGVYRRDYGIWLLLILAAWRESSLAAGAAAP